MELQSAKTMPVSWKNPNDQNIAVEKPVKTAKHCGIIGFILLLLRSETRRADIQSTAGGGDERILLRKCHAVIFQWFTQPPNLQNGETVRYGEAVQLTLFTGFGPFRLIIPSLKIKLLVLSFVLLLTFLPNVLGSACTFLSSLTSSLKLDFGEPLTFDGPELEPFPGDHFQNSSQSQPSCLLMILESQSLSCLLSHHA